MYPEQFELLQTGDIIKDRRGNLRIIERTAPSHIEKDFGKTYIIYLKKLRTSWTKGDLTAISRSDSGRFVPIKVKNKKIWEWDREKVLNERKKNYIRYKAKIIKQNQKLISKLDKICQP
jgi:hypothetical protein